jgi:hypothetical protein
MDQPGGRYRELARRCRDNAAMALSDCSKAALIEMANGYDERAATLEVSADA